MKTDFKRALDAVLANKLGMYFNDEHTTTPNTDMQDCADKEIISFESNQSNSSEQSSTTTRNLVDIFQNRFDSLYDSLLRLNFTKYSNKNKNSTGDFIEFENFNCDHNPFVDKFKIVRKNTFNYREGIDKYESFFSNLLKGKRLFKKKLKLEDLNFKSIENENKGNTLKLIATDTKPYKSSKKGNIKARRFKLYNCILMTDNDVYYNSKINFQFF